MTTAPPGSRLDSEAPVVGSAMVGRVSISSHSPAPPGSRPTSVMR